MKLNELRELGLAISAKYGTRKPQATRPKQPKTDRGQVVRTPEERRAYRNAYFRQWQQRKREREAAEKARIEHGKTAPLHGKRFMRRKRWLRREPVTLAEIIAKA